MGSDGWHLTDDIDDFLPVAGAFLRSRPALHTMPLTTLTKVPTGLLLGRLEEAGAVRAICYRRPSSDRLTLTSVSPARADALAAHLAGLGRTFGGVTAEHDTATAFAAAWQRHTGAAAVPGVRVRLYRLGTLTSPGPLPAGRGRLLGEPDRAQIIRWCADFATAVGETPAATWADSRYADKHFTFWETTDGTPVSIAGATSMIGGMIRVDPVYTPAHLRGRGYAGAVTVEVSRAALAAGATDVVLFTNPANPTSNALYQRIGYVPIADFTGYDFS